MENIKLDMVVLNRYGSEHRPLPDSYHERRHSIRAEKEGWLGMCSLIMIMLYILKCNKRRYALLRSIQSLCCADLHRKLLEFLAQR